MQTLSDAISSVASKRPLYLDGLEQSVDPKRGTRWDVNINEIGGGAGTVVVWLYEAGNRNLPIAETRFEVSPYEQLRLESVFAAVGLDTEDRRKDRTNVLCAVSPERGSAVIAAFATVTDNATGDARPLLFSPAGGVPSTGVLRITKVTPLAPPAQPAKRRAVR